jgi:hypothetical protein
MRNDDIDELMTRLSAGVVVNPSIYSFERKTPTTFIHCEENEEFCHGKKLFLKLSEVRI